MNVLSCCASACIADTLWNYLGYVNVAEEDRQYINMKNEFYYSRVVVTYAKKSYIAWLLRQEGVVLKKPKLDVKGVNFFKSTASEKTSNFIYEDLLRGQIFQPEDGEVSLRRIYRTIADFQNRIADEIRSGDMGYLKRSIKVKSPEAYNDPMRINAYKGVFVWNSVVDDKDRIKLPATTTSVKVKLKTKKDVAALAPWPKIYNRMLKLFEENPDIGDHEETKNGKTRLVRGKGINAIALPNDYDEVPDWVLAIIDTDTLVYDNLRLMEQLYKPLGFQGSGISLSTGSTAKYYTNIVRI